jgi:hypothetical protein
VSAAPHKAHRMTPAMAAGLTDKLMEMTDVARLIDDAEMRRRQLVRFDAD